MHIDTLLKQFGEWAELEDSYSIKKFAKEVGVPYKTILALSKEDEKSSYLLDMVKLQLSSKAIKAALYRRISCDDGIRYLYENDDGLRERLRENEGVIVPDDEEEFDAWFKERIVKDYEMYGLSEN